MIRVANVAGGAGREAEARCVVGAVVVVAVELTCVCGLNYSALVTGVEFACGVE